MEGRSRPRRPAVLDAKEAERLWGDSDPALTFEAAHATANAVLFGPSHLTDDDALAGRVGAIIDAEGLDEIAALWSRSPATTLPGALWRLYLLRDWLQRDPETITMRFREGTAQTAPSTTPTTPDDAGEHEERAAAIAPQPAVLDEQLSELFDGASETELAELLEQSAAFLLVLADATPAGTGWRTHDDDAARPVTGRSDALTATAQELSAAAVRARAGKLD